MFEFYTAEDVMRILKMKRTRAYEEIILLNKELKAKGKRTKRGMVSKKYFEERWG